MHCVDFGQDFFAEMDDAAREKLMRILMSEYDHSTQLTFVGRCKYLLSEGVGAEGDMEEFILDIMQAMER